MAAVLITMWFMANGNVMTQSIEMVSLEACDQAKSVLFETTEPLLYEDSFLKEVEFACQGRHQSAALPSPNLPLMRRIRDQ